jgi:hypothetical protein
MSILTVSSVITGAPIPKSQLCYILEELNGGGAIESICGNEKVLLYLQL